MRKGERQELQKSPTEAIRVGDPAKPTVPLGSPVDYSHPTQQSWGRLRTSVASSGGGGKNAAGVDLKRAGIKVSEIPKVSEMT